MLQQEILGNILPLPYSSFYCHVNEENMVQSAVHLDNESMQCFLGSFLFSNINTRSRRGIFCQLVKFSTYPSSPFFISATSQDCIFSPATVHAVSTRIGTDYDLSLLKDKHNLSLGNNLEKSSQQIFIDFSYHGSQEAKVFIQELLLEAFLQIGTSLLSGPW